MAGTPPPVTYFVLPVKAHKGQQITLTPFTVFDDALQDAIRQAAAEDAQYFIVTSTHYIDKVGDWPEATRDSLALIIVTPPVP
ncbi:hypothetical protein EVC12_255 [Rhizobium phage RHph_I42]|nr:hypothetical protein EVC12_255 [Rhizobium phage RHph_I42]